MAPSERNIKISIDESVLKRLMQTVDEAVNKMLRNGPFTTPTVNQTALNGAGIFDTASGLFKTSFTTNQKENKTEDTKLDELTKKMLGNFEAMLAGTQKMLQNVGLMNSEFGKIIQMIMQFVNSFSKAFEFGKSVFGFISNLFLPGSGTVFEGLTGDLNNITESIPNTSSLQTTYPMSPNFAMQNVNIVPKSIKIRGRDLLIVLDKETAYTNTNTVS